MDAEYLKASVGDVLATGITETVLMRPDDPIEYLAQYLLKSVSDEASAEHLAAEKAEAVKLQGKKIEEESALEREKGEKQSAIRVQVEREDKRLQQLLLAAENREDAFSAVLGYIRNRTGASSYILATDLPQKVVTPPPPPPPEQGDAEPNIEESEAPPPAAEEEPAEAPSSEEPPPPKPKHVPLSLAYVAWTKNDEKLLQGKTLVREAPPAAAEDEEEEAAPAPNLGDGVAFDAVDAFLKQGAPYLHIENAVEDGRVKFWYIPRMGGLLIVPVPDLDGDVPFVLVLDLLGHERTFTDEEIAVVQKLVPSLRDTLHTIELQLASLNLKSVGELTEAGEAFAVELAAAVDEATAKLEEDPLAVLRATEACHKMFLGRLSADQHLRFLKTRDDCDPSVLLVLKAMMFLFVPGARGTLPSLGWKGIKAEIESCKLPWDDLFSMISELDVVASADAEGWSGANAIMAPESEEEPQPPVSPDAVKASSVITFLMLQWFKAAEALFKAKVEKEQAEAAAAAAAAEAAAAEAAAAEAANAADGDAAQDGSAEQEAEDE